MAKAAVLGKSTKAKFQHVEFNIIGGFDDIAQHSVALPEGTNAEFAVLRPPRKVSWYHTNGKHDVDVELKRARTANGNTITTVDLDSRNPFFSVTAAMCFPVDEWTEKVFSVTYETRNGRALTYLNFRMIRWIRPENIHLLRLL